jgi:hypothetical protein
VPLFNNLLLDYSAIAAILPLLARGMIMSKVAIVEAVETQHCVTVQLPMSCIVDENNKLLTFPVKALPDICFMTSRFIAWLDDVGLSHMTREFNEHIERAIQNEQVLQMVREALEV